MARSRQNLQTYLFKNQIRASTLCVINQFPASLKDLFIQIQFTLQATIDQFTKLNTYEDKNQINNPPRRKEILAKNMLREASLSSSVELHLI